MLRDLCTLAELLREHQPDRESHRLAGLSVTTIGRVARCLIAGNGGYSLAVSRKPGALSRG